MSNRRDAKRRAPHATITVPSNSPHGGSIPEQLRYGEAIDSSYRISPSHMSPVEGTHTPTGPPGRPKPPKTSRDSHGRTTHQRNKSAEEAIMREVKESETSDASEPPARDDMQYADVENSTHPGEQPLEEQQHEVGLDTQLKNWKKFLLIQALLVQIVLLIPSILWAFLWILQKLDLGRVAFFVIVLFLLISALILTAFANMPFYELLSVEAEACKAGVRELVANLNDRL